jgi:PPOX class probable F420-dependent enzyme
MTPKELLAFLRRHSLAVVATVSADARPQAAVVGFVVSDQFELFFDTLASAQKAQNLRGNPRVALVVGWDEEQTVQIRGVADEPKGADLERLQKIYFDRFLDGPQRRAWPGITYVRVRPDWIRYSDFRERPQGSDPSAFPPAIVEFDRESLEQRS